MAQMFPEIPRECTDGSLERDMFDALAHGMPDDYYVFHSFSIVQVVENTLYESETDFVIFHPKKGLLSIEAKAGQIEYDHGEWKYGSGIVMHHDGPFNQASQNKWKLKKYIEDQNLAYLLPKCKMLHAVWFPSVTREYLSEKMLPPEADVNIILTRESKDNIETEISAIFQLEVPKGIETNLGAKDVDLLLRKVLAPSFKLVGLSQLKAMHRENVFKRMLKEQVALLNYLEEQNTAVINGMAGTGKTVMALEKARMHADAGEQVLFLCYNSKLKDFLKSTYAHERVDFYTVDGLACKLCDTTEPDYIKFEDCLLEFYTNGSFPWKHIIIDEGQDFGQEKIDEIKMIDLLKDIVIDNPQSDGTFYIFYDKNQLVQGRKIPDYIEKADCKLTLYRNCRNTENIAITSNRLLGAQRKPKLIENPLTGDSPEFYVLNEAEEFIDTINRALDSIIDKETAENIVILTCKTEQTSKMAKYCSNGIYKYDGKPIQFTTYRKFKGLEADAVVIIDVDSKLLDPENFEGDKALYVGSSRARFELSIVCDISSEECTEILNKLGINNQRSVKKPYKALATALNAKYKETV